MGGLIQLSFACWLAAAFAAPVDNVRDAFNWVEDAVGHLSSSAAASGLPGGDFPRYVISRMRGSSISTAFSGIGTPEQSCDIIASHLSGIFKTSAEPPACDHAVELEQWNREELLRRPAPPKHIFGDVTDFLHPAVKKSVLLAVRQNGISFDQLSALLNTGKLVQRTARCYIPGHTQCQCGSAYLHLAGSPCVDFSAMGARKGICGTTLLAFMVWVGLRLLIQEPVVFHENVPSFPEAVLQGLLGHVYHVQSCVVNLVKLGQPVRRVRRLTALIHRTKVLMPLLSWPEVPILCERECRITFKELLLASDEEVESEFQWAAARPNSRARSYGPEALASQGKMELALTECEATWLSQYRLMKPGAAYSLKQNPEERAICGTPSELQCILKGTGIVFVDELRRWICPYEFLACQGYPVYPITKIYDEGTSFDQPANRNRARIIEQCGNAMHTQFMGLCILWAYGCVKPTFEVNSFLRRTLRVTDSNASRAAASPAAPAGPGSASESSTDESERRVKARVE